MVRKLERALKQGHPWIYRDALAPFDASLGAVVEVTDRRGRFVARGIADGGPIAVRVFTCDRRERIDASLFERRMAEAAALRDRTLPPDTSAYRLLHGEGDRLPGLACDVYGTLAVMRFDGEGIAAWHDTIVAALQPLLAARGVATLLLRSGRRDKARAEHLFGPPAPDTIDVTEHGMVLVADILRGQKTGLFLDHRESRARVRALSRSLSVLNLYGYTGGFSVAAGLGRAERVDTVDQAGPALALARASWEKNELEASKHRTHETDVFEFLAGVRGTKWDLVIADPPSFAPNEATRAAALSAYRKLHALALSVVRDGGLYLAASCSSHIDRAAFLDTLLAGAGDAHRILQLLDSWGAPPDHPRLASFPEGDYLKVFLVRALH